MFVLFDHECSTSEHHMIFSSKEVYMFHLKCARRELNRIYLNRYNYVTTHTSLISFVCVWRRCRRIAQFHEWMFWCEVNFKRFPMLREKGAQWRLCRDPINRNTVHSWSSLLTSWLSELGVLNKRDMQNMQSGGGVARNGIQNHCTTWLLSRYM